MMHPLTRHLMANTQLLNVFNDMPAVPRRVVGRPRKTFVITTTNKTKSQYDYACKYGAVESDFIPQDGAHTAESAVRHFAQANGFQPGAVFVRRSDGRTFGPYNILA